MSTSLWVAVGLAVTATIVAIKYLPRHEEHAHAHAGHGHAVHIDDTAVPVVSSPA
jgi:hypothetical protein